MTHTCKGQKMVGEIQRIFDLLKQFKQTSVHDLIRKRSDY